MSKNTPNKPHQQSSGRKKIEIKKIEPKSNLQVSYSKRRVGLFKKAGELCVLCGVHIAIVVSSPGKKIFSFGHPGVNQVIERFLEGTSLGMDGEVMAREYDMMYEDARMDLVEKKWSTGGGDGRWWERNVGDMDMEELELFQASLKELRKNVEAKVRECDNKEWNEDNKVVFPLNYYNTALNHVVLGDYHSLSGTPTVPGHGRTY